jgi:hypothetical protein
MSEENDKTSALIVSRNWLAEAMRKAGADVQCGALMCDEADADIEIGGLKYVVSIRLRGEEHYE